VKTSPYCRQHTRIQACARQPHLGPALEQELVGVRAVVRRRAEPGDVMEDDRGKGFVLGQVLLSAHMRNDASSHGIRVPAAGGRSAR
jgi:hypothetical protein